MALTKQTKLARKRMNLIRSAQQRMFRQLRFPFTTSWCPTLYSGGGKRDHAPKQLVHWLKFPLTHRSSWGLSCPPLKPCPPLTHMLVVLLWNSSGLPGASSHFKSHISLTTSCSIPAGPTQKVLTRLVRTDLGTFVRNPNRWRRNPVGKACECATASSSAD